MNINYARIARNDDAPSIDSPWDDPELASTALFRGHTGADIRDALAEYLSGYRTSDDQSALVKRLEAIGDSAMDDYLKEIGRKPE